MGLTQPASDDCTEGCAQIYAHVEDGVSGIAADIGTGIQLPHDHGNIGF